MSRTILKCGIIKRDTERRRQKRATETIIKDRKKEESSQPRRGGNFRLNLNEKKESTKEEAKNLSIYLLVGIQRITQTHTQKLII